MGDRGRAVPPQARSCEKCHLCLPAAATSGLDFEGFTNRQVVFGTSPFTISVQLMDDEIDEQEEEFQLVLNAGGTAPVPVVMSQDTATIAILDDDRKISFAHFSL